MVDMFLYHWSPQDRRPRINRSGLLPNQWSVDKAWKPPYICVAPTPSLAWGLSGRMHLGPQKRSWDLWQVWLGEQSGHEELFDDRNGALKEIRVYERIYKRNVWYVASREN